MPPEPSTPSPPARPSPAPTGSQAPGSAVRRRSAGPDRTTTLISALVLLVVIVGGAALVAFVGDDGSSPEPAVELDDQGRARPQIIPRPNSGEAPDEAGDRGGWAQLALLGLIVVAIGGVSYGVVRGTKRSRANRAAWLAAAESDADGVLDGPR